MKLFFFFLCTVLFACSSANVSSVSDDPVEGLEDTWKWRAYGDTTEIMYVKGAEPGNIGIRFCVPYPESQFSGIRSYPFSIKPGEYRFIYDVKTNDYFTTWEIEGGSRQSGELVAICLPGLWDNRNEWMRVEEDVRVENEIVIRFTSRTADGLEIDEFPSLRCWSVDNVRLEPLEVK